MTVTLPMPPAPPPVMRWGGRFAALLIGRLGRSPEVAVRHGRGDSGDGLVTIRGLYAARRLSLCGWRC